MVKIDIAEQEAQALIKLIDDANCPAVMGYALTMVKFKVMEAFKKEADKESKKEKKANA